MSYDGWLEFNGTEMVNISRTVQIAEALGIDTPWVMPDEVDWIETRLGDTDYADVTTAPWYDAGYPASAEFAGIMPLGFPGLDDSTLTSSPVEYVTDGGHSGKPRNSTLSIVASIAIIAQTDRGAEFGKRWLDRLLRDNLADSTDRAFCTGAELRYFRWADSDAPIAHRRDVRLTRGTSVTKKRITDCSATWLATFTLTAADPFEYGEPLSQITGFGPGLLGPNLVPNPGFETNTTGWTGERATIARVTTQFHSGVAAVQMTRNTTASLTMRLTMALVAVDPSTAYRASAWYKAATTSRDVNTYIYWYDSTSTLISSSPLSRSEDNSTGWVEAVTEAVSPSNAAFARVWPYVFVTEANSGEIHYVDDIALQEIGAGVPTGPGVATAGHLGLVQASCPVYDYTPIYDPLYPALVASPTSPDFYPAGWTLEAGQPFTRNWVRLNPVEPSDLLVVPVITLSAPLEARMVRISIWPNGSDFDDQCDPLFVAVLTYLPPGVDVFIDGEQKAAYVWDGSSAAVRRIDSLVYSGEANPIDWVAFNDPESLLVTLDVFDGSNDITMSLDLVPKSD